MIQKREFWKKNKKYRKINWEWKYVKFLKWLNMRLEQNVDFRIKFQIILEKKIIL